MNEKVKSSLNLGLYTYSFKLQIPLASGEGKLFFRLSLNMAFISTLKLYMSPYL